MKIIPAPDKILIKPITADKEKKRGYELPKTAQKERASKGEVIAVGKEIRVVGKGGIVYFHPFSPSVIKEDDNEYLVAEEDHILAIGK